MLVLMCETGGTRFGLRAGEVIEVVARPTLQSLPRTPLWLGGAFIYRGTMMPVVDLAELIGARPGQLLWSSRIVVVRVPGAADGKLVGLLVDRVNAETLDAAAVKQAASRIVPWGSTLLDDRGSFCLLDLETILTPERMAVLFPG